MCDSQCTMFCNRKVENLHYVTPSVDPRDESGSIILVHDLIARKVKSSIWNSPGKHVSHMRRPVIRLGEHVACSHEHDFPTHLLYPISPGSHEAGPPQIDTSPYETANAVSEAYHRQASDKHTPFHSGFCVPDSRCNNLLICRTKVPGYEEPVQWRPKRCILNHPDH